MKNENKTSTPFAKSSSTLFKIANQSDSGYLSGLTSTLNNCLEFFSTSISPKTFFTLSVIIIASCYSDCMSAYDDGPYCYERCYGNDL